MELLKYKTRGDSSPQGKPRVYFCCHPAEYGAFFEDISNEILGKQNCAVWYLTEPNAERSEELLADLKQMQLFVMPVTSRLLCTQNPALDIDFRFAIDNHIPVLPLMQERDLEQLFNEKCGDLQFLDKQNTDTTAISYDEKLENYLNSVLIGDELAEKIRAAFDAYVFLSYRKKDRKYAQELMRLIHKNDFCRDIAIWYDEFLTPGENFNDSIKEALKKSGLFVLAVTPNLVNETNYIMATEYPMAREAQKPILPAELVPTDKSQLSEKYTDIPPCTDAHDEAALSDALLKAVQKIAMRENDGSPEHNFFIGLAYLGGVDVEVDHNRALQLIVHAGENGLPEAMEQLIHMYTDGLGVSRDQSKVLLWSDKLANYYFNISYQSNKLADISAIIQLFDNYTNSYWSYTIQSFLRKADCSLDSEAMADLFSILMSLDIYDFSLLFDVCADMKNHGHMLQTTLLRDILKKTTDGIYKPYGQLFCWPSIYNLYSEILLEANNLLAQGSIVEEKACILVSLLRDLCVINGYSQVTDLIDPDRIPLLLQTVAQSSTCTHREKLNTLFFFPTQKDILRESAQDDHIYPQIFSLSYLLGIQSNSQKTYLFHDEYALWDQITFSDSIGIVKVSSYTDVKSRPGNLSQLVTGIICISPNPFSKEFSGNHLLIGNYERLPYQLKNLSFLVLHINSHTLGEHCFSDIQSASSSMTICLPDRVHAIDNRTGIKNNSFCNLTIMSSGITSIGIGTFSDCAHLQKITLPLCLKEIGAHAFARCFALTKVNIPDCVDRINEGAFYACSNLEAIQLPKRLKLLGNCEKSVPLSVCGVFEQCSSLKQISIPPNTTSIGAKTFKSCIQLESVHLPLYMHFISMCAFESCKKLRNIQLPYCLTVLSLQLFRDCTSLTHITVPETVKIIGYNAFDGCTQLSSITLPEGLQEIGQAAFLRCTSLVELDMPKSVTTIGWSAFSGCTSLLSISSLGSITAIGNGTFKQCYQLTKVPITNQIKRIGYGAFAECHALQEVTIPESVERIEDLAFENCSGLQTVQILGRNTLVEEKAFSGCTCTVIGKIAQEPYLIVDDSVTEIPDKHYARFNWLQSVVMGKNVRSIGKYAFSNCAKLAEVVFNNALQAIGSSAFSDCVQLTQLHFPEGLTQISEDAFQRCAGLTNIVFPGTLTAIENGAFAHCTGLTQITIPQSVIRLGSIKTNNPFCNGVFMDCTNLRQIYGGENIVDLGIGTFSKTAIEAFNIPPQVTQLKGSLFFECAALTCVTAHNNITAIEARVFEGCLTLGSIRLPERLQTLGWGAFRNCRSIEELSIPDCVSDMAENVFEGCVSLRNITLPPKITAVKKRLFYNCSSLEGIQLGDCITSIEEAAFGNCTALRDLSLPFSITAIGDLAFSGCTALQKIELSAQIKTIGCSAFAGCHRLEKIDIPMGVEKIQPGTFARCCSLSEIHLPDTLITIEDNAFADCTSLKELTLPQNVSYIGQDAFYNCVFRAITVPLHLVDRIIHLLGKPESIEELQTHTITHYQACTDNLQNGKNGSDA